MALTFQSAPAAGIDVIRKHMTDLVLEDETLFAVESAAANLTIAPGLPVYTATLRTFLGDGFPATLLRTAWHYLILDGDVPRAVAELAVDPENEAKLRPASLKNARYAERAVAALAVAEAVPQLVENDYDLRILRVPGIYLTAVWLSRERGGFLIPVAPIGEVKARRTYEPEAVQIILRRDAELRMSAKDREG